MSITKAAYELAYRLQKVSPTVAISATACGELVRLNTKYRKIQERWCCEEMTDERVAYWKKAEARIEKNVKEIAQCLAVVERVEFEGDPRGSCIRLHLYSQPDGEGVCL